MAAICILAPLAIKGLRALRSEDIPPPAPLTPLPPFFSVEMPWINQHLVNIDAQTQMIIQHLRDENGRNRLIDILDRLDAQARRLEAIERANRVRNRKV